MTDFRINYGQSFDFFKKVTVSRTTFGDPNDGYRPDIMIPFSSYTVILSNEGSGVVQVSFNGFDVQDELDSTLTTKILTYENRVLCKIWFKIASGSALVSTRAWGIR